MRRAVRERLLAATAIAPSCSSWWRVFGDYVLLEPPFKARTLVLWLGAPVCC